MESKDELKKNDIKNHMCYYFDDIITARDIYFGNILLDEKLYENILIHDIYIIEIFCGFKTIGICFNKIGGFIKTYDGKLNI